MADRQIGNTHGLAIRGGEAQNGGASPTDAYDSVNKIDIASMRTRLGVINAGTYTTARLNEMSYNDMMYAIRLNDNPTTMNQEM